LKTEFPDRGQLSVKFIGYEQRLAVEPNAQARAIMANAQGEAS
jgi:hypothetical protein